MTKRLTAQDIEAIRKRAEAATGETWYIEGDGYEGTTYVISSDRYYEIVETYTKADADFIAHSREDIPALLAEVERLREVATDILREYITVDSALIWEKSVDMRVDEDELAEKVRHYTELINGGDTE